MMGKKEIDIEKNDVLKNLYFIAEMSQNTGEKGMYGTIAGKDDLMGGIFDRWINLVPESAIFNKIILPEVTGNNDAQVITDFYKYKPKQDTTWIAPDVLGLKVNNKTVPFVEFDEKWKAKNGMPQIEVKTFKKSQMMVSLRDQGYKGKYLVLVESSLRVDYLLPFFDSAYFTDEVYEQMTMDDATFIKSDSHNYIKRLEKVTSSDEKLGTLSLLLITKANDFKKISTKCGPGITPLAIESVEEYKRTIAKKTNKRFSLYLTPTKGGLYDFKDNWYLKKVRKEYKYLSFSCDSPESIKVVKKNKFDFFILSKTDCKLNEYFIKANTIYKVTMHNAFSRAGTKNCEYFIQKSLLDHIPDRGKELKNQLKEIIENNL